MNKPTRKVVCAANRYFDTIVIGIRHYCPLMQINLEALTTPELRKAARASEGDYEQGFVDQWGVFMDRKEAMAVVKASGQPFDKDRNGGSDDILFSEGVW